MKKQHINLPRTLMALLFCLFFISFFQGRTGKITGKVTDEEGYPLPGVTVTLRGPNMIGLQTVITSESGVFRFHAVPGGTYSIKAEMPGFATQIREIIVVQPGRTIHIDFTIAMTGIEEREPWLPPPLPYKKLPEYAPSDLNRIINEEIKQLSIGQILFNPPEEMTEHIKDRIEMRISQNINEDLTEGLKGRGIPQIEQVRVSTVMTAKLSGDDFKIKPLSDMEQPVLASGYTQWEWDVTPLKAGRKILQLSVAASINVDTFGEKKKSLPVMEKEIYVKVNPKARFEKIDWYKIIGAIGGVIGIIATIIGIYFKLKQLKKRKKEKQHYQKEEETESPPESL